MPSSVFVFTNITNLPTSTILNEKFEHRNYSLLVFLFFFMEQGTDFLAQSTSAINEQMATPLQQKLALQGLKFKSMFSPAISFNWLQMEQISPVFGSVSWHGDWHLFLKHFLSKRTHYTKQKFEHYSLNLTWNYELFIVFQKYRD